MERIIKWCTAGLYSILEPLLFHIYLNYLFYLHLTADLCNYDNTLDTVILPYMI